MNKETNETVNKAKNAFQGNHNCSQSLLLAFNERYEVPDELSIRLASGFGGGIALTGSVCGAVTGGIMVLGLSGTGEGESKMKTYEMSQLFQQRFVEKFGSLKCQKLVEPRDDENDKRFCDKFVEGATKMIEELLEEN